MWPAPLAVCSPSQFVSGLLGAQLRLTSFCPSAGRWGSALLGSWLQGWLSLLGRGECSPFAGLGLEAEGVVGKWQDLPDLRA